LILNPVDAFGITDFYLTVNVGSITGIAALEAAYTGVPIAAIQLDRAYERRGADWIWASPDPDELATYIASLLDQPAQLEELARRQKQFVLANHSLKAMADAYERFYQEGLERRNALLSAWARVTSRI
jgi:glycosyltransferase involved in cell wall biosynthesis